MAVLHGISGRACCPTQLLVSRVTHSGQFAAVLYHVQYIVACTVTDQSPLIDGLHLPWLQVPESLSLTPAAIKLSCDASAENVSEEEQEAGNSAVSTPDRAEPSPAAPSGWDLDPTPIPVSSQLPCYYGVTPFPTIVWPSSATSTYSCFLEQHLIQLQ